MDSRPNPEALTPTYWMSDGVGDPEASSGPDVVVRTVRLAVSGDRAAFEWIVRTHERRVLTVSWRLLGRLADAEDAAQEVFLRAFRYLHRFDPERPLTPWLMRITVNVCRDFQRKSRAQRVDDVPVDSFPHPRGGPLDHLEEAERFEWLRAGLESLPERERAAIVLRDLEGMSTREVAEALDSSPATVRSQISSARLKIRRVVDRMKGRER